MEEDRSIFVLEESDQQKKNKPVVGLRRASVGVRPRESRFGNKTQKSSLFMSVQNDILRGSAKAERRKRSREKVIVSHDDITTESKFARARRKEVARLRTKHYGKIGQSSGRTNWVAHEREKHQGKAKGKVCSLLDLKQRPLKLRTYSRTGKREQPYSGNMLKSSERKENDRSVMKKFLLTRRTPAKSNSNTNSTAEKRKKPFISFDPPSTGKSSRANRRKAETLFAYPPMHTELDQVTIVEADLARLHPGVYLNDSIIDFYLKYLVREHRFFPASEVREAKLRDTVKSVCYVFSSFFFPRLMSDISKVDTWTKKVDIFSKKFLVIPINESQHWSLAIICNPFIFRMVTEERDMCSGENLGACILIFDSLGGRRTAKRFAGILRDYLKHEWKSRKSPTALAQSYDEDFIQNLFNEFTIPLVLPRVPKQRNSTDCGVYLLEYVEHFFKDCVMRIRFDPEDFDGRFKQYISEDWFSQGDISAKRREIHRLMVKKGEEYKVLLARNDAINEEDDDEVVVMSQISDTN